MITGLLVSVTCGLTVCSCAVFSAGRRQQINPLGQQAPPGAAVLPQVVHFNFPVVQNISATSVFLSVNPYEHAKLHPKCFFFFFPHLPSELWKSTLTPQDSKSSMRTRQLSGSLRTRRAEPTCSTEKPAGGVLRKSSTGVTSSRRRDTLLTVMAEALFAALFPLVMSTDVAKGLQLRVDPKPSSYKYSRKEHFR